MSPTSPRTRPPAPPAGAAAHSEEPAWDAPLFEAEADDIVRPTTDGHDEIVDTVGVLWDRLSTLDHGSRNADGELLDEAFTHGSLDIGRATPVPLLRIGPSQPVSPWPILRRSLIRLLVRAGEQGYVLRERLLDHLPAQFVTADTLQTISALLADQGVEVLDEPPSGSELLLDSPAAGACGWDEVADEELAPGSDAWEDIAAIYFRQATAVPLLSREEERSLARALEQARRSFLQVMTASRPAMEVLRETLAEVQAGRISAHRIFDWLPERIDSAEAEDEALEPDLHADPPAANGPGDALATIRANCAGLAELLASGVPAASREQVKFAVLRDELVGQLGEARFSGHAMRRLVESLAVPGLDNVNPDDLRKMVSAANACRKARGRLIEANLRLVMWVARKYRWTGMPLSDLLQEGNLGLMRAVDRFDHRREARFSTYATWWIRQGITRSIGNDLRVVRLPVHVHETLNKVKHAQRLLDSQDGTEPSPALIAEQVGLPEARVRRLLAISSDAIYMDFWDEEESFEVDDEADCRTQADVRVCSDAFEATARLQTADVVDQVLSGLLPREAKILRMRFGIGNGDEQTLEEIGNKFDLTRERIRQLETKGLRKLRHPVRRRVLETLTDGFNPDTKREVLWAHSDPDETGGDET